MKRFHIYSYLILVIVGSIWADTITVYNKSLRDIYVAIYYQEVPYYIGMPANGKRVTNITCLESNTSISLERPERKWGYDRELVFSEYPEVLADNLSAGDLEKYHSKNLLMLYPYYYRYKFSIYQIDNMIDLYIYIRYKKEGRFYESVD